MDLNKSVNNKNYNFINIYINFEYFILIMDFQYNLLYLITFQVILFY